MSSPVSAREAFKQGYMRGLYRTMTALHTAFRQRWAAAETEAMLRRLASEAVAEAEAEEFEFQITEPQEQKEP